MTTDFKKESIRANCMLRLKEAVKYANDNGMKVIVASDEEGNNWNEITPEYMEYEGTKDGYIALGVFRSVEEDEAFKDYHFCINISVNRCSNEVENIGDTCEKCLALTNNNK